MKNRKGLILICGLSSAETSSAAMKVLQVGESLEFVALVGTKETNHRGVETFIEKTLLKTAGRDLADTHVRVWSHNTSEFIADAQTATSEAIMWMLRNGLDRNDIVVDVTAGRRSFCHGAFIAAEAEKIETQLVSDAWDHTTNKRVTGEETIKLIQEHY